MAKSRIITVQDVSVTVSTEELEDYICITDIAEAKSDQSRAADVIRNWLRNRSPLEYLSVWEQLYNSTCLHFIFDKRISEAKGRRK